MSVLNRSLTLRTPVLALGLLVFAAGGFAAYKRGWLRSPEPDQFDPTELATLTAASLPPTTAADPGGGWPQWRGPARDGVAPPGPLRSDWEKHPPIRLWSVPLGGGYSSFAVVDGRAYTQDKQGGEERVVCLDAATGATVWEHRYPAEYKGIVNFAHGPRATPTVHAGRVYAVGAAGVFVCLEPPAGPGGLPRVVWRHDLLAEFGGGMPEYGFAGSPVIDGATVIVQPGAKGANLAAFDAATGELRWKGGTDTWGYSSPVVTTAAGVRQVVAAGGTSVFGVRADDGRELWRHPWVTDYQCNIATPVVVGDYVFYSSAYNKGCVLLRLKPAGGGVVADQVYFKPKLMRNHFSTSVHRDGFLYGFDADLGMKCVDLRKGQAVEDWEARDADNKRLDKGSLILAGDKLVGLTTTGGVFLADADPKEFQFRGQVKDVLSGGECWALPVLADGKLFLRDAEKAVCLDVRPTP